MESRILIIFAEKLLINKTMAYTGNITEYLRGAYDKIEELSKLKADWDGEGALPISQSVLNNIKSVLLISKNSDWKDWMIGPDANATIGLQSKTNRAMMSLGAKEFSYYVRKNGERIAASHVDFTPELFLETMHKIM